MASMAKWQYAKSVKSQTNDSENNGTNIARRNESENGGVASCGEMKIMKINSAANEIAKVKISRNGERNGEEMK
jgi:hypothetical protein